LQTLPIDLNEAAVRGDYKSVNTVVLSFLDSRGGWIGQDASNLVEIKPRYDADGYDSIQLRTYEKKFVFPPGWTENGQIYFRQTDPLPVTILAISPEVSIG